MSLKKRALDELIEMAIECPDNVRPSMLDVIAALTKQHPISAEEEHELLNIVRVVDGKQRYFRVK